MEPDWDDKQPIYVQVHDRIVAMILDGLLEEGAPLPSVRALSAEYRINHLTVSKGYQQLVDEGLVEKRRGIGMFVADGARGRLGDQERTRFLSQEWPAVAAHIKRLGLSPAELLATLENSGGEDV